MSRSVIYESPWVSLYADKVRFPGGRIIEKHHILDFHTGFVGVVVENDAGEVLLVHAYRYPLDTIEWEVVTGRMEETESPIEAARREVLEESGYETGTYRLVYSFNPINGISDKVFHVLVCRAGEKVGEFDTNEVKEIKWVDKDELKRMIKERALCDGFTLTALLLYLGDWVD